MYLDLTYRSSIAQATGVGLGVGDLTIDSATSGEYAMLRGDHAAIATATATLELHVRLAVRSVASIFCEIGFCDSDRTDYARFLFDTDVDSTYWRLECRDNSTQNAVTLPTAAVADTFVNFDLVWNESFVAGWFDGDGPYVLTANQPAASLTPYILVGTRTSATKTARIDRVHIRAIDGDVAHPTEHPILVNT